MTTYNTPNRIENFAFTDGTLTSDQMNALANSQNLTTLSGVLTADNSFELYISTNDNELGNLVTSGDFWPSAYSFSLAPLTLGVTNYLHLVAHNAGGPGGVLGEFHLNNDLGKWCRSLGL